MNAVQTKVYRQNRGRFPADELRRYDGRWVAFRADGQQIVASGDNLAGLVEQVRAAGKCMEDVVVERIEMIGREVFFGGAGLS